MSPGSRRASPQSAREVVELDRDEAMRLLASVDHGRVVFTRAALPGAGVVAARRDGNAMIYSIAAPDIAELLAVARKVLARVLSDRVAVLEDLRAGGSAT